MILKSMNIQNYRPYKEIDLDFAYGEENITIILGANDVGKTSLLNAFTWCLYNKEPFRDEGLEERWNKSKSEELDINDSLKVQVEIVMEDSYGRDVYFTRHQSYTKIDNYVCRPDGNSELTIYISEGSKTFKVKTPSKYLNNNLPESLQEYFMFTGERLTQFFDGKNKQVKEGVHALYQLDLLEEISKNLKTLETSYNNQYKRNNPKLANLKNQRSELIEERDEAERRLKQNKETIESLRVNIKKMESEIGAEGGDVSEIQSEINDLKIKKEQKISELEDKKDEYFKLLAENFSKVFSLPLLKEMDKWEDFKEDDDIDVDEIFVEAKEIKKILKRRKCVCGNEFEEGDQYYDSLNRVLNFALSKSKSDEKDIESIISDLLIISQNIVERYPRDIKKEISLYTERIHRLKLELNSIEISISDCEIKLKKLNIDYINELLTKIKDNNDLVDSLIAENGVLELDLNETYPFAITEIDNKIEKAKKTLGKRDEYGDKRDFCESIKNISKSIYNELSQEVHHNLEEKVTEEYKRIHWKPEYKKIKINSDFEVFIEKTGGNLVSATDPSTGSRNVLSLTFMAALNSLSNFVLPQVIDTPIASLSVNMQKNVAQFLPEYMKGKQMILLVMDSEYRGKFESNIKKHVGKEYVLGYVGGEGVGKSIIKPFDEVEDWSLYNIDRE